jgi:hypothetical protein
MKGKSHEIYISIPILVYIFEVQIFRAPMISAVLFPLNGRPVLHQWNDCTFITVNIISLEENKKSFSTK